MAFRNQSLISVLQEVTESMKTTGTYSGVYTTVTTCTVANSLKARDVVNINDVSHAVITATDTYFTVEADVSSYTEYTTGSPYFMFGHMLEIASTLARMDKAPNLLKWQKYPLIILKLDTESSYTGFGNTFDYTDITLYLCNITQPTYKAAERLENNFEKVLYPIYEKLIKALKKHPSIRLHGNENFKHTKIDRFFWGTTQLSDSSNYVGDYLDAIEINKLNLSINNKKCK